MSPLNPWIPWSELLAKKHEISVLAMPLWPAVGWEHPCCCVAMCSGPFSSRINWLIAVGIQDTISHPVVSAPLRSVAGAVLSHEWPCLWISQCWMLDASFPRHCCSFPFWPRAWSKVQRCLIDSSRPWIRPSNRRVPSAEAPAAIQRCRAARPQPDPGPEPSLKSQGKSAAVTTFSRVGGGKQREAMESKMLVFKYSRKLGVWR